MKYFVVSDIHSHYDELKYALDEKGFDIKDDNHKLIICGDCFDRGSQTVEVLRFVLELLEKNRVILIEGNHEYFLRGLLNSGVISRGDDAYGIIDTYYSLAKYVTGED